MFSQQDEFSSGTLHFEPSWTKAWGIKQVVRSPEGVSRNDIGCQALECKSKVQWLLGDTIALNPGT